MYNNIMAARENFETKYQKEVNELRAEKIAKNANLLELVATTQTYQDPYYQTSKSHKSYAPTSKASLPTRSHATIRHKGKEIAKPITPPSESASKEDSDPEQARKDKEMQKNLPLIAKYFRKIYKPTNSNLRTSSNTRNKNVDTTPRYKNDNQSGQFRNHRTMTVVGARETVGGQVVQQSGIQCFNCKEFGHFAKECRKPKRVKDSTYHKEKMLLCKQAEKDVQLQADYMAKIQKIPNADSGTDSEPLEQWKWLIVMSFLIDQTELEKYMAFNDCIVDYDKLELVQEKHDELVKQSLLTKSHYEGLVKEKTKVITDLKLKEEKDIDKMISMENQLKFLNEIVYKRSQSIQTIHMLAPKCPTFNGRPTFANPMYLKKAQNEKPCLYEILHDQSDPANRLVPDREEILTLKEESRSKLNKDLVKPYDYTKLNNMFCDALALKTSMIVFAFVHELKKEMHADLKCVESLENEIDELESDMEEFSNMYDLHFKNECDCLAQKLSKQTESVSKKVYTELLRSFAKLEKHSISLEFTLQQCQEQMKNDTVCKEKASNVFIKEREQYFEIQDLKAQLQDKDIAICDLKKLIEKYKGKYVETKFDKSSVVQQPNAQRILKNPSVYL
ncbi:retrovirus-related pol polyprotein from transposon TNT 1-94 [Tanacetum coccineum]